MYKIIVQYVLLCFCLFCVKCQNSNEICENLHNETIYPNHYCNLADEIYPEEYFRWMSGFYCYQNLPEFTFKNATKYPYDFILLTNKDNLTYNITFTWFNKEENIQFYYDYLSNESLQYIEQSFDEKIYFEKWKTCAKEAYKCCKQRMPTKKDICPDINNCPAIWDGRDCFSHVGINETIVHRCPPYLYVYAPHNTREKTTKQCPTGGLWEPTIYKECIFEKSINSYEICDKIKEAKKYEYCNLRDELYPSQEDSPFFQWVAGFSCYYYGPGARLKNGLNNTYLNPYTITYRFFDGRLYTIPVNKSPLTGAMFFYDYTNVAAAEFLRNQFTDEIYYNKWVECSKAAVDCCKSMNYENICPDDKFSCPKVWDAWDCFPQTQKDHIVKRSCPTYINTADPPCVLESEKQCAATGNWVVQTNYDTCEFAQLVIDRHYYHVITLGISSLFCLPAIIIFYMYRPLRITRVILHRNFLISIVIKNIFVMTSKLALTIFSMTDSSVLNGNEAPCKLLAFFERVSINMMYACMLIDGYYLHKAIVRVFNNKETNIYILYGIISVLSFIPIIIWAILKATLDDTYCWIVDSSWRQWIIDGVRYFMLGVNTLFLLDILRVFISKWWLDRKNQNKNSDFSSTSHHALRATLVLLPLFLVQFAMMSQKPANIPCVWDSVYYYFAFTMDSIQGVTVALLYCYCNKEVQGYLRRSYENYKFSRQRRQTINMRKNTAATYVADDMSRVRSELTDKPEESGISKVQNWFKNH